MFERQNGLRFYPVVISANARVKPDFVLVADKEERHPEGAYYLEWYEGSNVTLSPTDVARLEEAIPASAVAGSRYDEHQMRILDPGRFTGDHAGAGRCLLRVQAAIRPVATASETS